MKKDKYIARRVCTREIVISIKTKVFHCSYPRAILTALQFGSTLEITLDSAEKQSTEKTLDLGLHSIFEKNSFLPFGGGI